MKGASEVHLQPTEYSSRHLLASVDLRSHSQIKKKKDAFYAVIYTARAPGKASTLTPCHSSSDSALIDV